MPPRPESSERSSLFPAMCSVLWVTGFLAYFFLQKMPNTSVPRGEIWQILGKNWPIILNPFDYSSGIRQDAGWEYFGQRIPFIITAVVLLGISWGLGNLSCRRLLNQLQLLRSERCVIVLGVGLSLQTLWVLTCGLTGQLNSTAILTPGFVALTISTLLSLRRRRPADTAESIPIPKDETTATYLKWLFAMAVIPFVIHILLGGMTPPWDFDVREYHMQGPKEWFLAGSIQNLAHNVYTSFPFLSEMLSLAAMVVRDDWWEGAISGKLTLASFQFLSAVAVFAVSRRWFGQIPAGIAVAAFLSTPWIVRISDIAYAEGAITFYLIVTVMTALLGARVRNQRNRLKLFGLAGFLAGSAMASKYPGVLSVVLPVGLFLFAAVAGKKVARDDPQVSAGPAQHRMIGRHAIVFIIGVVIAVGPWLLKNMLQTGNPVYPLAYSVFGASDWSPEMDAKWKNGHRASEHSLVRIPEHIAAVAIHNDWQSPFLFAFAIPALLLARRSKTIAYVWLHLLWLLATWWFFTHRIDRFWVPLIPVTAVLAGAAWKVDKSVRWKSFTIAALSICTLFNYALCRYQIVIGFHGGLIELNELRQLPIRSEMKILNTVLPKDARVLMVGEAQVFDAQFDLVYNTVFDESIFQQWTSSNSGYETPADEQALKPADEIRQTLDKQRITHIVVNWSEILRYRLTYGYTDYVFPKRFRDLQNSGVLGNPMQISSGNWNKLDQRETKEAASWAGIEELRADPESWYNIQLYPVNTQWR